MFLILLKLHLSDPLTSETLRSVRFVPQTLMNSNKQNSMLTIFKIIMLFPFPGSSVDQSGWLQSPKLLIQKLLQPEPNKYCNMCLNLN